MNVRILSILLLLFLASCANYNRIRFVNNGQHKQVVNKDNSYLDIDSNASSEAIILDDYSVKADNAILVEEKHNDTNVHKSNDIIEKKASQYTLDFVPFKKTELSTKYYKTKNKPEPNEKKFVAPKLSIIFSVILVICGLIVAVSLPPVEPITLLGISLIIGVISAFIALFAGIATLKRIKEGYEHKKYDKLFGIVGIVLGGGVLATLLFSFIYSAVVFFQTWS